MGGPAIAMWVILIFLACIPALLCMFAVGLGALVLLPRHAGQTRLALSFLTLNLWEPFPSIVVPNVASFSRIDTSGALSVRMITALLLTVPAAMLLPAASGLRFRDPILRNLCARMLGVGAVRWLLWLGIYFTSMMPADRSPALVIYLWAVPVLWLTAIWGLWELSRFEKSSRVQALPGEDCLAGRTIAAVLLGCVPPLVAWISLPAKPLTWDVDGERLTTLERAVPIYGEGGSRIVGRGTEGNASYAAESLRAPAWSSAGVLASGARVWRVDDGRLLWFRRSPYEAALTADGRFLAAIYQGRMISVWKNESGKWVPWQGSGPRMSGEVQCLDWSPDGRRLAYATSFREIMVWDAVDDRMIASIEISDQISSIKFAPDGRTLGTTSWASASLRIWRSTDLGLIQTIKAHESFLNCLAFSPDGETVLSGGIDRGIRRPSASRHTIKLWRLSDGQLLKSYDAGTDVLDVAYHPGGRTVCTAGRHGVLVWRLNDGARHPLHGESADGAAFSPDGARLALASPSGVAIWKLSAAGL